MRFPTRNKIAKKCDLDKNIKYRQIIEFKPKCFWYSLGKEWYNYWFVQEKLEKVKSQVVCEVKINKKDFAKFGEKEKGKILVIDTMEDVKKLRSKYGMIKKTKKDKKGYTLIDFGKLSENYSGIEFRNYRSISKKLKENKNITMDKYGWYYMIDVSSGCVWDLSLIEVTHKGKLKDFV